MEINRDEGDWLLIPQGVSGEIKKRGGAPAVTGAGINGRHSVGSRRGTVRRNGTLPFKPIIHVAGINMFWRSSERSIRDSVRNALTLAAKRGYRSIAIPLIGAGSSGGKPDKIQTFIEDELHRCSFDGHVRIVQYTKTPTNKAGNQIH